MTVTVTVRVEICKQRAHPDGRVAAAGGEHVERRVHVGRVDRREVAVIVAHDAVLLEVPALDRLVLADRKQVRVARAHAHRAHRRDVARERQLQRPGRQVPDLHRAARTAQ